MYPISLLSQSIASHERSKLNRSNRGLRQYRLTIAKTAEPFELSVELCDDEHISELNLEWRGKRGPTDVLSFEADSPPGYPMQLLGDVVISVETAARQAAERRWDIRLQFI